MTPQNSIWSVRDGSRFHIEYRQPYPLAAVLLLLKDKALRTSIVSCDFNICVELRV